MQSNCEQKTDRSVQLILTTVLLTAALIFQSVPPVFGAPLVSNRFDKISDSSAGATATHQIGFSFTDTTTPIGSLNFEFCSNDPVPESTCVAPTGFDLSAATLATQSGTTGFNIHANSTTNNLILSRPPAAPSAANSSYEISNVVNPTTLGTYYIRIRTFSSTDATGSVAEQGGIALSANTPITVSAEVPPYIRFCAGVTINGFDCSTATSFFIDLGEFSTSRAKSASSELIAATNAAFGYTITLSGTTLTSGTNTISALASQTPSAPGTSQFGINLRANSAPGIGVDPSGPGTANAVPAYNVPNLFRFQNGESIVTSSTSNDNRKFTVSYIANINGSQPAGVYATTISFICLANF